MASGLPPHVASAELITSAWGNQVVDELTRKRGSGNMEIWAPWTHPGGTTQILGYYDNGTTNIGPFSYPVRTTVFVFISAGYSSVDVTFGGDIVALNTGGAFAGSGSVRAAAGSWLYIPLSATWDVAAGLNAGFRTRTNFTGMAASPTTLYYGASGQVYVQRTDT